MGRDFLIQLTNHLYHLTLLFPKKEPLRYKMRELADEVLANFIFLSANPNRSKESKILETSEKNLKNLEILNSFFEVAKNQNWVKPSDLLAIKREYDNLREEIKEVKVGSKEKEKEVIEIPGPKEVLPQALLAKSLSERQEKTLAFLKENGKAQVWQIKQLFPEVSKRTLRRDFESMLNRGLIERLGERNETFYQIKISQS